MGYGEQSKSDKASERYHRLQARKKQGKDIYKVVTDMPESGTAQCFLNLQLILCSFLLFTGEVLISVHDTRTCCGGIDVSCQTDTNFDALPAVERENEMLRKEVYDLRKQITDMTEESKRFTITEATFKSDSNLLKFYTGK